MSVPPSEPSGVEAPPQRESSADVEWAAIIGNPNTGKTTLFNALTGGRARTGNYPGVTVDKKVGTLQGDHVTTVRLLDLPGTYSLAARSPDEMVAVDVLLGRRDDTPHPSAVIVVVDATNLERNLYLVTQVMETGLPTVVALNMVDSAEERDIRIDDEALSTSLGVPVVRTVASHARGVEELKAVLLDSFDRAAPTPSWSWPPAVREAERELAEGLSRLGVTDLAEVEVRRALFDEGGEAERALVARGGEAVAEVIGAARASVEHEDMPLAGVEATVRYAYIGEVAEAAVRRPTIPPVTWSDRLDAVLTHRVWGTLTLIVVMSIVFMAIFSWAAPVMDLIDTVFGSLAEAIEGWPVLGDGALKSLLVDGAIAGVGGVIIFLPQILILFLFLAILEGCGYMARAAFLMDRLFRACGLSGRSFIPMLSSFACAVPGVMATRTIGSRRDRIVTLLVAPLMSCSARIPVYVLFTAAFVPAATVLGFMNLQGLVFAAMYLIGVLIAIPVAFLLKKTLLRGDTPSFLVELPPFRMPRPGVVLRRMFDQGKAFLLRAGTVIFAASIVVWALSYFPRSDEVPAEAADAIEAHRSLVQAERQRLDVEAARQEQVVLAAEAQDAAMGAAARKAYEAFLADAAARNTAWDAESVALEAGAKNAVAGAALGRSYLGRLGHHLEPVFAPMGWDWKVSAAVVASFPAREVVVSTLGVLYNLGPEADEGSEGLRDRLRAATWESGPRKGKKVFDVAGAVALMVFFALCAQCMSTLVVIKKETGRWAWAGFSFAYMTVLAYVGALLTAVVLRGILGS